MSQLPSSEAVCIVPRLQGLGGPASFRARLVSGLAARGVPVVANPYDPACRAVLVIGGTKRIDELLKARRRDAGNGTGVRVVQRLNGMNWIHRRRYTGPLHFLRSEVNNFILSFIRRYVADRIVYQSQFARTWWQTVYRQAPVPSTVIYNSVDLNTFTPIGPHRRPEDCFRVLMVEGHLGGGNEEGLRNACALAEAMQGRASRPVELMVVGDVPDRLRVALDRRHPGLVRWAGVVPRDAVPEVDRSAHVLFSADLNAACPNSVIEALACGLPVVSYATGSLPELIEGGAGLVVPWGSNFWKLEPPDIPVLADAALQILSDQETFRAAARARAEAAFGLETMVTRYLEVLLGD
jgi:glycosyltransferase involved in cell wall biosynthesis